MRRRSDETLAALRAELDNDYEAQIGLKTQHPKAPLTGKDDSQWTVVISAVHDVSDGTVDLNRH